MCDTCDKTWFLMISENCMRTGLCYCYIFLSEKCLPQNTTLSLSKTIIISNVTIKETGTWTEVPTVITTSEGAGRKKVALGEKKRKKVKCFEILPLNYSPNLAGMKEDKVVECVSRFPNFFLKL